MMEYDEEVIIKLHDTYSNANSSMNDVVQDNKVTSMSNNAADLNMMVVQQNNVLSDAYNKISFSEWGEEDGDFEIDEEYAHAVQSQALQDDNLKQHQEFMDEDCDVQIEAEETVASDRVQPNEGKNNEKIQEMPYDDSTKEIENMEQSLSAQVTEVPVQSVLIDQKDVSILEGEITKSKQSEKGKKKGAKKTPGRKKAKVDSELSQYTNDQKYSADENSDIDSSKEDSDLTPSITKSGRKVQKPVFYNPARSERKIKSSDISNEHQKILVESKKTPVKRTAERRQPKSIKSSQSKPYDVLMRVDHAMTPTPIVPKSVQRNALENIQVFNQLLDSRDPSNLVFFNEELESDDSMVCNTCQEGLSEKGNWIVLCDSCDTPYHQICHKPVISDEFADSEKEWKCLNCTDFPNANKRTRTERRNPTGKPRGRPRNEKSSIIVENTFTAEISKENYNDFVTSVSRVGPASKLLTYKQIDVLLTREQKIEYFSSLPKEVLVNLLLLAEQIAPNIPLYPANILQKYRDINVSKYERSTLDLQAKTEVAVEESTVHMDSLESSTQQHEADENSIVPKRETPEVMTPESTVSSLSSTNVPKKDSAFYVDIFIKAITTMNQPNGSSAHSIYSWIKSNYAVPEKFQSHAKKHLFDAVAQGIIVKNTKMTYKLNNSYPHMLPKGIGENPFKPLILTSREGLVTQNNQMTKANLEVILDQSNQTASNNIDEVKGPNIQTNSDNQGRNLHNSQLILPVQEGNSSYDSQSALANRERCQSRGGQLAPDCRQRGPSQLANQPSLEHKPTGMVDQAYQESSQQMLSTTKSEHKDVLLNNNAVNTSATMPNQNINFTRQEQIPKNHRNPVPVSSIVNGNIAPRPSRIRPPNSFLTNQYLAVPRQNINQGLNNFSLSNQSLSMLTSGIGSQTILPPINPQQQQQQQQQHWPTSFNPFYMIPNTNDNQFGLMHATYPTYGQSQQTASYRGHSGMQSNGSLMNGNHNGQNINGSVNSSLQEMG